MYTGENLNVRALDNGLIEMHFDAKGAPVNLLDMTTVAELTAALELIDKESGIRGMLITSGKSVFIAGADISEFGDVFKLPKEETKSFFNVNNDNLNRLESLPFPTVCAINGFALGGGLEFCLACDFRVMSENAVVGLPETGYGIMPGWGGTVRMPRLIGLEAALTWIASGAYQNSATALQDGLAEQVVEPDALREESLSLLNDVIASPKKYAAMRTLKSEPLRISPEQAQEIADRVKVKTIRTPQLVAPTSAIELTTASCMLSFKDAMEKESNLFADLGDSAQARALIGNFLNDRAVKKLAKTYARNASLDIDKASVVGAGIMGGGIAYQNAFKKIPVVMKDIADDALQLGMDEANKLLSKRVAQGRVSEEQKVSILNTITPTLDASDMDGSKVIVEAVVENPKIKESVLAELERHLAEGGVLASNTSTISITSLAKALKNPDQFAGLHFFNPVHAMPLVEVIRGEKTSDETIANLVAYSLALGKQPIVVNDCPAFLVNRVLFPLFRGFEQLVNDGADFQRIDRVMEAWGWPMGPAYLADVIGIDTVCHCTEVLANDFPDRMSTLERSILGKLATKERFGQKNNKGFYKYEMDAKGRPQRSPDEQVNNLIVETQTNAAELTDKDIELRCLLPMAIEMARCLEESVVASPAEADMALLMGLGFPAFRGGITRWMDEVGLSKICEWADQYSGSLGEAYQPTPGMREMAKKGTTYY
jgi:3-hydroxyacyl-CoA dehydrogenase/enoyl-CoA hydratase/3-hydroxybutyryl-CoA epimerase/enoyl-CoA isomerase